MSRLSECEHSWLETDVACEICGDHGGLWCEECGTVVDLVMEDDPR